MIRKVLSVALLCSMIPVAANAWTLSSRVMTSGGTLQVGASPAQSASNGTITKSYTADVPVVVDAGAGYLISGLTINGVAQPLPATLPATKTMGLGVYPTKNSQSITASFKKQLVTVTASSLGGGTVYPTGARSLQTTTSTTYKFTPAAGKSLTAINGLPAGAVLKKLDGTDATLPSAVAVNATFTVPATNVTMSASFAGIIASAASETVVVNDAVTLSGSSTVYDGGTASYAWTQVGGPAVTLTGADTAAPSFTAAAAGVYQFKVVATSTNGATDDAVATITAAATAAEAAQYQCNNCHTSAGVGAGVFTAWAASKHEDNPYHLAMCYSCHTGANEGAHPGTETPQNACLGCHAAHLPAAHVADNSCVNCHDEHSLAPVAGSIAAAHTPNPAATAADCAACHVDHTGGKSLQLAQYVSGASLPVACADCHTASTANKAIRVQYAVSGHADTTGEAWIHYDWRSASRSTCARCHNGTAFAAKLGAENSTAAVFQATDILKPGETLACSACHADVATGALREAASEFSIAMTNNTATFNVPGASTLCARCHSGRESGDSIEADANTTGIRVFPDVHYKPAAAVLYNKGYDYGDNSGLHAHQAVGEPSQGPCVTCHMPGKNHSFAAAACVTCHDGTEGKPAVVDAATLKANYDTALNNLKLALQAKNIYYEPAHPFFYTFVPVIGADGQPVIGTDGQPVLKKVALTDWSKPYGAASWKQTMGAAYNYNMLWSEQGAWAHNNAYAMKLIADSINFIEDGALN